MRPTHKKPVIAVAGGIGSGKSLVAGQLADLGCGVIDADALARQALELNEVRQQLVSWWGNEILDNAGRVDRAAVARIVFNDAEQLDRLEALTHPHVYAARAKLHEKYAGDPQIKAIVEDCPLLMEVGLDKACDAVIFVDSQRPLRLKRLAAERGWDEPALAQREKNQWPLDKKAHAADYIVANNVSAAECFAHVRGVFSKILSR